MKNYTTKAGDKLHILRLDTGDDVLACVNELIEKEGIKNGAVISGIGTLDYCVLHMVTTTGFPAVEHFERWENKPLELTSVDGLIADGIPHLHAVVSDSQKAYSGHLEPGCRILYLGEMLIMEIEPNRNFKRVINGKGINTPTENGQL